MCLIGGEAHRRTEILEGERRRRYLVEQVVVVVVVVQVHPRHLTQNDALLTIGDSGLRFAWPVSWFT